MELTTSRGQTFNILYIGNLITNSRRIMIEIADDRLLSEIAADFEDVQTFRQTDPIKEGEFRLYEGYTHLVSIHRNMSDSTVRMTLEKG